MSTQEKIGPRASDEELMRLLDGELDQARRTQVLAQLDEDDELRGKVAQLGLVGDLLREHVDQDSRADGIADEVIARLSAEPAQGKAGQVIELPLASRLRVNAPGRPNRVSANDNARSVFWMAGLAAAVAVGLFFWSRASLKDMSLAEGLTAGAKATAAAVAWQPSATVPEPAWLSHPAATAADRDDDSSAAVEVASVDFGSNSGSVFYVSTGSSKTTTTTAVVWVTDGVPGGKR